MGAVVHVLKAGQGDVRVLLGGRKARVAQQFLDVPQVGAAFQKMSRERVAQGVGMHVPGQRDPLDGLV